MDDDVSSEATVLGLDNIPLELPIAGAGSRALSAFLDYLLVGILVVALGRRLRACARRPRPPVRLVDARPSFLLGFFVIEYGYFAGVEIAREGQTFGKWALGLRVVDAATAAAPGTAALLSATRCAAWTCSSACPSWRRTRSRAAGRPPGRHPRDPHPRAGTRRGRARRTPAGWSAQEAALLETFLRRAPDLEAWRAERLARQLLARSSATTRSWPSRIDRRAAAPSTPCGGWSRRGAA